MSKKQKYTECIFTIFAFALFIFLALYKLTDASLWFDEAIEYWVSKNIVGVLPYFGETTMYDQITSTLQPPLYNILIFFWLKISDTEWWFRFFGVITGTFGMFGIYKTVKIFSNSFTASIAVIFSSITYIFLYYWLECSEYCLMLVMLCFSLYYFVSLINNPNKKTIILFTIFLCLSAYSQYGAAFPILGMATLAFLFILSQKEKKNIQTILICYGSALIFAALPLYIFFLRIQMGTQNSLIDKTLPVTFENGFFNDCFNSLINEFKWIFLQDASTKLVGIILLLLFLFMAISFIFGKIKPIKYLIILNIFIWFCYYFAVKFRFYAYGNFGKRYCLFFAPLWIILIIAVCYDVLNTLQLFNIKFPKTKYCLLVPLMISFFAFCIYNWNNKIHPTWYKQDNRGAVASWYEHNPDAKNTLVYYGAGAGFSYYIRQNDSFTEQTEDNVDYMPWMANKTKEEYIHYLNNIYGTQWPNEVYLMASHTQADLYTIAECFTSNNYTQTELFNHYDGILYYFCKP